MVKAGDNMNSTDKLKKLINNTNSGVIKTSQITKAGVHRGYLYKFIESGELYRFSRGLYVQSNSWEDDFYLLQQKYKRGIYSNETALYLLGYSDRTPAKYTMTFPKGYNAPSLKKENLIIKRTIAENYNVGIIAINSPSGNPIKIYDIERTLCDIMRGNGSEIQTIVSAMKLYVSSKNKNIYKLLKYAELFHVKEKVLRYLEVLL